MHTGPSTGVRSCMMGRGQPGVGKGDKCSSVFLEQKNGSGWEEKRDRRGAELHKFSKEFVLYS